MHDDFGLYPREESFDPFSVMLFKALQVIAHRCPGTPARKPSRSRPVGAADKNQRHRRGARFRSSPSEPRHELTCRSDSGVRKLRRSVLLRCWRERLHYRQRQENSVAYPRGDCHHPWHRSGRIYHVNVSHFQALTHTPVSAKVKVQKLNPTAQVIYDNIVTVDHTGDEKTPCVSRLMRQAR